MFVELTLFTLLVVTLFYKWATQYNDFFEKRGIPYKKPFPLFGNMHDLVFQRTSMFELVIDYYNSFDSKVFGIFDQRKPLIVLKDPELVKHVTIKEFDHFINHRTIFASNGSDNNLFGSSLFQMSDGKWKDMRSTLSPAFTGKKMRNMFELINQVAQDTVEELKAIPEMKNNGSLELDVKDYTTRCTSDIIASTAFGLKINSFRERNNEFYRMGKDVTNFTTWQNIKFFMYANFKTLMKIFKIELFAKKYTDYFKRLVLDAMDYRKKNDIVRPDMINMMMEARGMVPSDHPRTREWSDNEIVGQCFAFFFAGFETASVLMCFAAHELMENKEVQERLAAEVLETTERLNGQPMTYEDMQSMKYLDMVICETLRKWPPAIAMDRVCNKDFVYESEGQRIEIKKGDNIWIPASGFHRDPKYFKDPMKFNPERFSKENEHEITPNTYMPFGLGPRNCIASRFAQLEAKSILFYIVRDFLLEPAKLSSIPMQLSKGTFQLLPKDGFWLKLRPRNRSS